MINSNSLTPHDDDKRDNTYINDIVAATTRESGRLTMQGPEDYGFPAWTHATFYTATIKEMDALLDRFKSDSASVTVEEQMKLADFLIQKANDPRNGWFYFIPELIIAAKINKMYTGQVVEEILWFATNAGWSKDVVPNLESLGIPLDTIRDRLRKILTLTLKKYNINDFKLGLEICSLIFCLKQAWLEKEIIDIEAKLKDNPEHWKIQFLIEYDAWSKLQAWDYIQGEVTIEWVNYVILYKNRDYKRLIPESEYKNSMFYDDFIKNDPSKKE